ncbi:tetratricopeptide repeat protein [Desulfopila aestuarii]|uniref:Predicted methyltransferase, contains TPR repeat n=1 Tax=Desulfopila aestuarii DSM 18488 TaxID=1121416 RepID=A0A1M7XWP1_9BACT|nr:tetratricopeptide repeat protein [Desulfopila aestuarii]SHO43196.1 Predicted methyltransferase, contains TPR repeat [Desulfopila aestuarii DSM 18488]
MDISRESCQEDELNRLFAGACTAQTEGRFAEAEKGYLLLLQSFPDAPLLHYNLGLVYYSLEDFSKALREFSLAHDLQPDDADMGFNLALCLKKTGDITGAIDVFRQLLVTMPDHTDCWYNLAGCYREIHDDSQAITCYSQALALNANYLPALNNLAYLYHRQGDHEQAAVCYQQLLALRPEDESAKYMLASISGKTLDCAPDVYVRSFFDAYAEGFEQSLVDGLGYDNPRQLYSCFARCQTRKIIYDHGLDLGCGTGLAGVAFQDVLRVLDGVDLSANMLRQAAEKECYSALYQDSICNFLQTATCNYDLFLATDVFIYVGELQQIFSSLASIALPEALFCFSTEYLEGTGYCLRQTGRFAYSSDYIRTTAANTGWTVLAEESTRLRKEREEWLEGRLWILGADSRVI